MYIYEWREKKLTGFVVAEAVATATAAVAVVSFHNYLPEKILHFSMGNRKKMQTDQWKFSLNIWNRKTGKKTISVSSVDHKNFWSTNFPMNSFNFSSGICVYHVIINLKIEKMKMNMEIKQKKNKKKND